MPMNIDEILKIAELMTTHDLTEFSIESEDLKLSLKRGSREYHPVAAATAVPAAAAPQPPQTQTPESDAAAADSAPVSDTVTINSPIVGTFYRASAPDADPFVKIGSNVTEDSVVCIVEAMKVMNEIKSEKMGVIKRVLVENGQPVEYGQPLFEIEPE